MTEGRSVERKRDNDAFTAIAFAMRLCEWTMDIGIDRALIVAQILSSYTYICVYILRVRFTDL